MTGHVSPEDRKRFLAAGMDHVLSKPVVIEELKAVLSFGAAEDKTEADQPPIDLKQFSEILGEEDEEELFEMLGLFVDGFPELLAPLEGAVEEADAEAVSDRAHAAKSAATSAAAVPLSKLLQTLEVQALDRDWPDISARTEAIKVEFSRIKAFHATRMEQA